MTFINWSDPEEMVGLLAEYVADERGEARGERDSFLSELSRDLELLIARFDSLSLDDLAEALREIVRNQDEGFRGDPVLRHVEDCIDELVRINRR